MAEHQGVHPIGVAGITHLYPPEEAHSLNEEGRNALQPGYLSRPPNVDATSTHSMTRWFQWATDMLLHMHECMDEIKNSLQDQDAKIHANALAHQESASNLDARIESHAKFHELMEAQHKSQRGVWASQWQWFQEILRLAGNGAVIAAVAYVLKLMGVI